MRISDWSSDVCSSDLLGQALPMLEWGLNWCIGAHGHQFLIIHAAVIERNGLAAILPGAPGSGKSTLTACLVHNGWRLLSDAMALVSLQGGRSGERRVGKECVSTCRYRVGP